MSRRPPMARMLALRHAVVGTELPSPVLLLGGQATRLLTADDLVVDSDSRPKGRYASVDHHVNFFSRPRHRVLRLRHFYPR